MQKTLKLKGNPLEVTIGCDPEFEQSSDLDLYNPIPTTLTNTHGEVGKDGAGTPIELRPGVHKTSASVIKKLRSLIEICPPMSTKGRRYAIGGHIHFGNIFNSESKKIGAYEAVGPRGGRLGRVTVNPSVDFLETLDAFIGIPTMWANGEARGHYGRLGAYELKPYGFEYRSPSAAWMDNPKIATMTFQFVREIINRACSNKGFTYEIYTSEMSSSDQALGMPLIHGLATLKSFKSLHHGKTMEEIVEWLMFFRNKQMSLTCNKNWGAKGICKVEEQPASIPEPIPTIEPSIRFHDDWVTSASQTVRETVASMRQTVAFDIPTSLNFFGLRNDRGPEVVFGGEAAGYTTITDIIPPNPDSFGIPYELRTSNSGNSRLGRIVHELILSRFGQVEECVDTSTPDVSPV